MCIRSFVFHVFSTGFLKLIIHNKIVKMMAILNHWNLPQIYLRYRVLHYLQPFLLWEKIIIFLKRMNRIKGLMLRYNVVLTKVFALNHGRICTLSSSETSATTKKKKKKKKKNL